MLENGTENGIQRIYLSVILETIIKRKDRRSAESWCIMNNVEIYRDKKGQSPYAIKAEVDYALQKPIIERYKKKYGENWKVEFELTMKNQLYKKDSSNLKTKTMTKNYKAKSKESQKLRQNLNS